MSDVDVMHAHTIIAGVGKAPNCVISASHRPMPLRYVWHHILPQTCGGLSVIANLVSLCDSCHYAVHVLLYQCKINGVVTPDSRNNGKRIALAQQGYLLAVAGGTVAKIPNEGSLAVG